MAYDIVVRYGNLFEDCSVAKIREDILHNKNSFPNQKLTLIDQFGWYLYALMHIGGSDK